MRRVSRRYSQAAKAVNRGRQFSNGLSLLLTAFMLLVAIPCHAAEATVFRSVQWAEATPELQGVDSAKLNKAAESLARTVGADGARELVVIRHGRIIWKGDNTDKCHGVYGFNWWRNGLKPDGTRKLAAAPQGTYWASGHNNNKCFVIPEWDMVIVRLGLDGKAKDEVWNGFLAQVAESLKGSDQP